MLAPLALGALMPWVAWLAAGRLDCWMMGAATLGVGMVYLACVHRLGDLELKLRRALGRRYQPPPPEMVLSVCLGLAASFLLPGLSCGALAEMVGFPRVEGSVRTYVPEELAGMGARISLARWAFSPGTRLTFLSDGQARMTVSRYGEPVRFAAAWRTHGQQICMERFCMRVDPSSGRLFADGDVEIGRVRQVGVEVESQSDRPGVPWELHNLFANLAARD
ncbi:MAG TPA: hypothetical protein VHC04_00140 [Rhodopila sp.]|nr:hypothetical protein [Rhodopila sp.]